MVEAADILRTVRHVVVQDYPRREVPETLTRAGFEVTIYGGPDESDVVAMEIVDGQIVSRPVGRRPDRADLLYVYRPLAELEAIVADARRMGVCTIWREPTPGENSDDAMAWRSGVESAGLGYLDVPDITDVARTLTDPS